MDRQLSSEMPRSWGGAGSSVSRADSRYHGQRISVSTLNATTGLKYERIRLSLEALHPFHLIYEEQHT